MQGIVKIFCRYELVRFKSLSAKRNLRNNGSSVQVNLNGIGEKPNVIHDKHVAEGCIAYNVTPFIVSTLHVPGQISSSLY